MAEKAKEVWLENIGQVKLLPKNRLGGGAMGTVFKLDHSSGDMAVKVLHSPTSEIQKKLKFILYQGKYGQTLPSNITVPNVGVYDLKRTDLIGYGMALVPSSSKKIGVLFDDTLRVGAGVTLKQVAGLFVRTYQDLRKIHNSNLTVVDWNRNNLMWSLQNDGTVLPFWIDFESWLIEGKNFGESIVLSAEYADPKIWDHVRSRLIGNPTGESDRYSFLYFLFEAMAGFKPYDGLHPKLSLPEERKQQGVWVLDKAVKLPVFGRHVNVFSDDLLNLFEVYFTHIGRKEFSEKVLADYYSSLVECPHCGTHFPRNRKLCPECQAVSKHTIPQLAYTRNLIQARGTIIHLTYAGGTVYALSRERDTIYLNIRESNQQQDTYKLLDAQAAVRFAVGGGGLLAVNQQGINEINLYDLSASPIKYSETIASSEFAGSGDTVFAANANGVVHVTGRTIAVRGPHASFPELMVDRQLPIEANERQTWFWADPDSDRVFGFNQVFEDQQFWLVQNGYRYNIGIPQADFRTGERVNELSVRFTGDSVLLLRFIRQGNKQFIRREVIQTYGRSMNVVVSQVIDSAKALSTEISKVAFGSDGGQYYIWHPTNNGIVREDIATGNTERLERTENVVREKDRLIHIGQGKAVGKHFLIQRSSQVIYISLN